MSLVQFITLLSQVAVVPEPPPDEDILMGDTVTLWGSISITFED